MALINCPECKNTISSCSNVCPHCGYPINTAVVNNEVRIKLGYPKRGLMNAKQSVTINSLENDNKVIWNGEAGEVIALHFDKPTKIEIIYHMNLMYYGGSCVGIIDPAVSNKYNVVARQGIMKLNLTLQSVDVFDSD